MRGRRKPILVPRARRRLARLGPVWAVAAVSLLAAFLPTSPAGSQTENEPGRLDVMAGKGPAEGEESCTETILELQRAGLLFPRPMATKDVRFSASNFYPAGLEFDRTKNQLLVAAGQLGTIGLGPDSRVSPLGPDDQTGYASSEIAADAAGNVFYSAGAGARDPRVMMVKPDAAAIHLAGANPPPNFRHSARPEDGVPALTVPLAGPTALASTGNGKRVFVAEKGAVGFSGLVREINPAEPDVPISTVAGGGAPGSAADGRATDAHLSPDGAAGLAVTSDSSTLYIAEGRGGSARVLKVDLNSKAISVVVGPGQLAGPRDVVVDSGGNLYISDENHRVWMRPRSGGTLKPVAGTGAKKYSAADTWSQDATFNGPTGLALDANDNLFIADSNHCVIRRVLKPGDAGLEPKPVEQPTTPTTVAPATTPTTVATPTPPGNEAVEPSLGSTSNLDPDAFGAGTFDFDPDAFGAGAFDLRAFDADLYNQLNGVFGSARGDALSGAAGIPGTDFGGPGAQVLPGAVPTPPGGGAAPVQPGAIGPPPGSEGFVGQQVGVGATSGPLPRGATRYSATRFSTVAGAERGAPVAAVAMATGAIGLFACVLALAVAPRPSGARYPARPKPRPRGAY